MLDLYKNIKNLREEKALSQDDLAKLTGYTSRSSIAKIEKGEVDLQQNSGLHKETANKQIRERVKLFL